MSTEKLSTDGLKKSITPELIQSIYSTVEKNSGDIESLRTILITLLAATLTGLTDGEVEEQIMRLVTLVDNNRTPKINPEIKP